MVPFAIRGALRTAAGALVLTALAAPSTAFCQRSQAGADRRHEVEIAAMERRVFESIEDERARRDVEPERVRLPQRELQQIIGNLQQEIHAVESGEPRNSRDLIRPWSALGLLYQENGDHLLAAAAFQRALDVARINYGLHALEQAPLIRHLIRSTEAVGDVEAGWDLEQDLLTLAGRHAHDVRTAQIFRETAERRMDVLHRYSAGELPPEVILGCYYAPAGTTWSCTSGSRGQVIARLALEAQTYYAQSIDVLFRNEQYGGEELLVLLNELLRISYAYDNPELGAHSLRYLLDYQTTNSEPLLTRIDTLVQLADWELVHSRSLSSSEGALAIYQQAQKLLREQGAAQASIARIFAPSIPVVLPAFLPNPLETEDTEAARGHIDIAFEVSKYGRAKRIDILDATNNSTRADRRGLVSLVARSRFRPRVTNGQFTDSDRIVVRYFLTE